MITKMNEIFKLIAEKIKSYDSIVIFGHMNPDGDCVGSVMGLKMALKEIYPNKKVYGLGSHPSYLPSFIEDSDIICDEVISSSLAILVDLSDLNRVEDNRINLAKEIVCFDHHVADKDSYPFIVYRDDLAPSATAILTLFLEEVYNYIPKKAAPYLYLGLVTDTGRFQFQADEKTFACAKSLIAAGVDYKAIYHDLYKQNSLDLKYRSYIYSHYKFDGLVCYCCVSKKEYTALGLKQNEASGKVNLLSLVDDHPIWALFTEQDDGSIRVELRSDGYYNVQKVAIQFNGGGHIPASGCKLTSFDDVEKVIAALNKAEKVL